MREACRKNLPRLCAAIAVGAVTHIAQGDGITFSDVIVFGDSLSDNGNLYDLTGGFIPISPPYYEGRFSNGPVWVEHLAPQFGVPADAMTNYAIGGSTTDDVLDTQIADHIDNGSSPGDALHIFWAGANDFLASDAGDPIDPIIFDAMANIEDSITTLAGVGATTFLMPNLPDLAVTPRYLHDNPGDADRAHDYTLAFNDALTGLIASLESDLMIDIFQLDTFSLMNDIIADPSLFGFTNVTDRALLTDGTIVDNPNEYLFWDDLHPTAPAHELFATYAADAIPAPASLALLAFGVTLRRRRRVRAPARSSRTAHSAAL